MIHGEALATQLGRDAAIAIATVCQRNVLDAVTQLDDALSRRLLGEPAIETGAAHSSELAGLFDAERAFPADLFDDRVDPLAPDASGFGVSRCKA